LARSVIVARAPAFVLMQQFAPGRNAEGAFREAKIPNCVDGAPRRRAGSPSVRGIAFSTVAIIRSVLSATFGERRSWCRKRSTSASHHSSPAPSPFDLDSRHRTGAERLLESSRLVDARFAGREQPVQHRRLSEASARAQKYDGVS